MYQKVVATGFLFYKGKTLIIQRANHESFLPGYFELPGGKVSFGEDPMLGLKREFLEEVNQKIQVGKPYKIFSYLSEQGARHTIEILFHVLLVDEYDSFPEVILSKDHISYAWISEEEIENYLITQEIRDSIKRGFQSINKNFISQT